MPTYNILLMGASYGSLLASKLLFGGHKLHLVCLPAEADLINAEGFRVRLPVRGRKDPVVLDSRKLPGAVTAGPATGVNPKDYDLVGLCMQEPQYRSPGVRELLDAVAKSRVPCMSIMNMPPLPYMKRIPGLNSDLLKWGGHIGYEIRPSKRRHGYGTEILRLGLEKAKQVGLHKALVTCDETNIGSKKIIENNGGQFENALAIDGSPVKKLRYWIDIP